MAYFKSYDPFDLRTVDLNEWYVNRASNPELGATTFLGRSYSTWASYVVPPSESTDFFNVSLDFMGTALILDPITSLPASGTVRAISTWFYASDDAQWISNTQFLDFAIPASALASAIQTDSNADDAILLAQIMGGADRIDLSVYDDWFDAKAGNDTLSGDTGKDTLLGNAGNDSILGGAGNDYLSGDAGIDRLNGGTGSDIFIGGQSNDFLTGQRDRIVDQFIFDRSAGKDRIIGFEDGFDKIVITTGAERMADLRITDRGADVLVKFGTVEITVANIEPGNLTKADFLFL